MRHLFTSEVFCYRLYWSNPGMGSIFYAHLTTREKRLLIGAEYSAQLYGITVFQVFSHYISVMFYHR